MRAPRFTLAILASALVALALVPNATGCSGSSLETPGGTATVPPAPDGSSGSSGSSGDQGDAAVPDAEAGAPPFNDGTPTRVSCTRTLGTGLTPEHGRLDGQLVSIVSAQERRCPADIDHLHLQVLMKGAVYDIAVNLDGFEGETDAALPGIPFAEGWHPMELDYVRDFNLHAAALSLTGPAAVRQHVEMALANANHIAVFGTGYPGSDGAHLIHRSSGARDGALVINPLAAKAHVIAFRFVNDTF